MKNNTIEIPTVAQSFASTGNYRADKLINAQINDLGAILTKADSAETYAEKKWQNAGMPNALLEVLEKKEDEAMTAFTNYQTALATFRNTIK